MTSTSFKKTEERHLRSVPFEDGYQKDTSAPVTTNKSDGGGGGMDNLVVRVAQVEKEIKKLKKNVKALPTDESMKGVLKDHNESLTENFKKLLIETITPLQETVNKLPSEDKIKLIVNEQIKSEKIATESFVKLELVEANKEVTKSKRELKRWIIGTAITAAAASFGWMNYIVPLIWGK